MTIAGGPATTSAAAAAARSAAQSESLREKKDLTSWWKNFKRSDKKAQEQVAPQGIFGVPLQTSIRYANVAISLFNDEGQSYIYGYVPIVVAKCGVFLKEKATDIEGIFRQAGSEKRIKELKLAFDSPDRYGKGLDWTGYTVHDAANILRRYFNQLPEPIIPLEFYQKFRDPLRNHQAQAVGFIEAQSPSQGDFDQEAAIRAYQALITELPPLNRQLLLYILDLLAVFASKADLNKMTTANLAAIFQPGILSHPQHDMAPLEYRLSQDVLIFLIVNQDSFLIGMQGTAADPDTVREVQNGTSKPPGTPTTPNRSKTVIGRSGSNSSVAAESVRKFGSIRRNVSVSSKHSKRSEGGILPSSPSTATANVSGGVYRSNTVPSRRGNSNAQSPRFSREKNSDPSTPNPPSSSSGLQNDASATVETVVVHRPSTTEGRHSLQATPTATKAPPFPAPPEITSASSSEATTPLAIVGNETVSTAARDFHTPKKDTIPLLGPGPGSDRSTERSVSNTPSAASGRKGLLDILKHSPTSDGEGRKPNKLQKKRLPGSALSSAQSSNQDLHEDHHNHHEVQRSPISPHLPPIDASATANTAVATAPPTLPNNNMHGQGAVGTYPITEPRPSVYHTPQRSTTDATLRPTISPSNSFHSHTDTSDADMVGDDMPSHIEDQPEKKKRNRWRFSRSQNNFQQPTSPGNPLGTMSGRDQTTSRSTIGSGNSQPRRSIDPTPIAAVTTDPALGGPYHSHTMQSSGTSDAVFSDSERERSKGPMSWLRNKIQERKDNKEVDKRSRTPERGGHERSKSRQDLAVPARERSFEQPHESRTSPLTPLSTARPEAAPVSSASPGIQSVVPARTEASERYEAVPHADGRVS